MTLYAKFPELRRDRGDMAVVGVRVDETYWGYVLRAEYRYPFFEIIAWVRAVFPWVVLILAAGLWAWLAVFSPGGTAEFRTAALAVIAGAGVMLLWRLRKPKQVRPELHFDQSRQELRRMVRDFRGQRCLIDRYAFIDIAEVYIESAPDEGGMGRLLLRLEKGEETIVAAIAPEHQLHALRRRIARDLRRSRRIKPAWFAQQKQYQAPEPDNQDSQGGQSTRRRASAARM